MAKTETLYEKLRSEGEQAEHQHPTGIRHNKVVKLAILVVTVLVCAWFFPTPSEVYRTVSIGAEWAGNTIVAQYPFPIYKPEDQYKQEVLEAESKTPLYFTENTSAYTKVEQALLDFERMTIQSDVLPVDSIAQRSGISSNAISVLADMPMARRAPFVRSLVTTLLSFQKRLYDVGFINISHTAIKTPEVIVRINATTEKVVSGLAVVDSTQFKGRAQSVFREDFDNQETMVAGELLRKMMIPNLLYSDELTQIARQLPSQTIPRTIGIVKTNEIIVRKGERVTELTQLKLQSYEDTRLLQSENRYSILPFVGNVAHVGLIITLIVLFFYFIRKKIFVDNWQVGAISLSFIVITLMAWASMNINSALPLKYLILLPTISMLIAIIFDSRTAFYTTVTLALVVGGVRANDYETAFVLLLGGAFANYTVRDLRSRNQMFKSIGSMLVGYTVAIVGFGLQHATELSELSEQLALASINAIVSPLLTFGALFIIERLFNITSDLRLLEYDNMNHPLLLELSEKAPGTYQHTLTIARLAESAARAIDGNPILAKAGAYFHDIGKIAKAEYFVENQLNIGNKHDRLSPLKSAAIIRNHVEDGIELGRAYGLPQRILDFIPMHHGTMLIKYFYVKAVEDSRSKGTIVNEDDFRYPGPKPKSREAAIVMLADSVEALSRTLDNSTPEELGQAIDSIIKERLLDGQFDECDLTMRELERIKQAFIRNLRGMQHQRIKYKNLPPDDKASAAPNAPQHASASGGKQ